MKLSGKAVPLLEAYFDVTIVFPNHITEVVLLKPGRLFSTVGYADVVNFCAQSSNVKRYCFKLLLGNWSDFVKCLIESREKMELMMKAVE